MAGWIRNKYFKAWVFIIAGIGALAGALILTLLMYIGGVI